MAAVNFEFGMSLTRHLNQSLGSVMLQSNLLYCLNWAKLLVQGLFKDKLCIKYKI